MPTRCATCETGLAKQPGCGPLHVWLGRSLESMQQLPAARDHLALALKDPDLDDEYREIAANRVEHLDYLLRDPPEIAVLLHNAQLATNEKRFTDLRLLCRNGLKTHPNAVRLRMPMAIALMQLEDYPGAPRATPPAPEGRNDRRRRPSPRPSKPCLRGRGPHDRPGISVVAAPGCRGARCRALRGLSALVCGGARIAPGS